MFSLILNVQAILDMSPKYMLEQFLEAELMVRFMHNF
jgi:hypothetical protein